MKRHVSLATLQRQLKQAQRDAREWEEAYHRMTTERNSWKDTARMACVERDEWKKRYDQLLAAHQALIARWPS